MYFGFTISFIELFRVIIFVIILMMITHTLYNSLYE